MSFTANIERISNSPALLGECPVWSGAEQVLYWADIDGQRIHRHDPSSGDEQVRQLPGRPGSFVLTAEPGRLLVAMEHELVWLDWATGAIEEFIALEEAGTGNRLNDGRCDPAGRFVVGSMYADTSAGQTTGVLHRVSADGAVEQLATGIGVANGLGFDAARGRMYFADTPTETVTVWDYDAATGERSNKRDFLDYHDLDGKPDGACVDADGNYWSASVYGWSVIRVTPEGVVDLRIELPVQKPSMPAFGGADLSTLYVTTIGAGGTVPSEPGRDGFTPGDTLAIDLSGEGIQGLTEPVFGAGIDL